MKKQPPRYEFKVDYEGTSYSATYSNNSGVLEVFSEYGKRSTHSSGPHSEHMARQLFREILEGAKSRNEI